MNTIVFDTLSDVFRSVRLKGAIFFDVTATPPWVAESRAGQAMVRSLVPWAGDPADSLLIDYHFVVRGECWVTPADRSSQPLHLSPGDIVAFPQAKPYLLSGSRDVRGARMMPRPILDGTADRGQIRVTIGDDPTDASVRLMCGFLACDLRPFNPILTALPPLLHMRASDSDGWVESAVAFAKAESERRRVGSASMLAKIGEMMFIDLVRRHIDGMPDGDGNWLAGLRDRHVGRALALLHERPADPWSLETLARRVGSSRSALAGRFTKYAGMPPMQYLKRWRMQLASTMLVDTDDAVAQIASRVGYDSEEAFSRAFKRIVGTSPSHWRVAHVPTPLGQQVDPTTRRARQLEISKT